MRLALILALLVVAAAQLPDSIDFEKLKLETSMGGPINDKGLAPCEDECLCDHPARPQAPFTKAVTLNELALAWGKVTASSFCDAATQVQMQLEESSSWLTVYNGPSSEFTIRKLPIDIRVAFRIRERNCAGVGPYSEVLMVQTPTDRQRPNAPKVTSIGEHEVCLAWEPFDDNEVSLGIRKVESDAAAMSPSWEIVFEGVGVNACAFNLSSSTYFQFRLTVHNPALDEPISETALAKTNTSVPLTPLQPYVVEATSTELLVQWSRPVSTVNLSPAQLFIVEVAQVADVDAVALIELPDSTPASGQYTFYRVAQSQKPITRITGLKPGTVFAIRVRAVNAKGESEPSPILFANTKPGPPGMVEKIRFASATADSIKFTWLGASGQGSPVTGFEVMMSPGGADADYYEIYNGPKNQTRVTGLLPEGWYGFKVRAKNAIGSGEWGNPRFIKTPKVGAAATDDELREASKPVTKTALALMQTTVFGNSATSRTPQAASASATTARQNAITASQLHLQLQQTLTPQARVEPDIASDNLSGGPISSPLGAYVPKGEPPVDPVDGSCDPRTGCLVKEPMSTDDMCPGSCNGAMGHGFCVIARGGCVCTSDWTGPDCNTPICTSDCAGHGQCIGPGTCHCNPGFGQPDCALYWLPVFHAGDVVTRANASSLRHERLYATNFTFNVFATNDMTLPYTNLNGGTINITASPFVPAGPSASHPHHFSSHQSGGAAVSNERPTVGTSIALPFASQFEFSSEQGFTVSLWFKASDEGGKRGGKLLSHGNHRHGTGYGIGMMPGGNVYCGVGSSFKPFRASDLAVAVTRDSFSDGKYHHVACRFDPTKQVLNMLIDGNEPALVQPFPWTGGRVTYYGEINFSSLQSVDPSAPSQPLVIGASYDAMADHFDGVINEVRIWNSLRTFDSIRSTMWDPLSRVVPGLALYLPLNDCSRSTVTALRTTEDGLAQAVLYPNTLTECSLGHHPMSHPVGEFTNAV